ncbi:hypothetical protein NDU88_001163 [Pleurodeles waltl]|uniref:Uncharacterized protein n=1 Tax=Pleurodeles waltl TaxID=8319 RepID=A0AAV7SC68_PLEWA|nr:hypothetical protein NDU88_001163 [Pleurodeles waltl]KAJ1160669.1 hypothetical protein NDU88_001163 [Pleurodeles waltl]
MGSIQAIIQGQLISHVSGKLTETDREARELDTKLLQQEAQYIKALTPRREATIEGIREDLKCLVGLEARAKFRARQVRLYDVGDEAGKLLAWLAKKEEDQRWISPIDSEAEGMAETPVEVLQALSVHLASLYLAQSETDQSDLEKLIRKILIPELQEEASHSLDWDFTEPGIAVALRQIKSGKSLGHKGLTTEFFKCVEYHVSVPLRTVYYRARREGRLSKT